MQPSFSIWLMSRGRDCQSNWYTASRLCIVVAVVADSSFEAKLCDLGLNIGVIIRLIRVYNFYIYSRIAASRLSVSVAIVRIQCASEVVQLGCEYGRKYFFDAPV